MHAHTHTHTVEGRKERKASLPDNAMVIQELDSSPPLKRRLPSAGEVGGKENEREGKGGGVCKH